MAKNPFADEPDDAPEETDHTVIRPMPGGRRGAAPKRPAPPPAAAAPPPPREPPPPPAPAPAPPPAPQPAPTGTLPGSPLAVAAAPLLQLLARLRNTSHPPDAGDLYERSLAAVETFEQRARDAGVPADQVRPASYALCASIDDTVLNTPWGAASAWGRKTLAKTFHPDLTGDTRFFDALGRMQQDPKKFRAVIEIFFLCLSLGYAGRYRGSPDLERFRATAGTALAAESVPAELSPRWRGIAAPFRLARGGLPVWVVFAAALAVCGGLFAWVSTALNAASDTQYARMLAAPPERMPPITRAVAVVAPPPPPPPAAEPTALDRLGAALKADIDTGAVSVLGTPATPILRVADRQGFSGAAVQPRLAVVLDHIAAALKSEPGRVQVIAYTDSQPFHTVQYPSNFQLSAARAKAASAVLAKAIGNPARLSAEGRADADPVASNATAEGREQNRRLDIVLHRQD